MNIIATGRGDCERLTALAREAGLPVRTGASGHGPDKQGWAEVEVPLTAALADNRWLYEGYCPLLSRSEYAAALAAASHRSLHGGYRAGGYGSNRGFSHYRAEIVPAWGHTDQRYALELVATSDGHLSVRRGFYAAFD
ncbi:MAG: hypothetical protein HUU17_12930 [Chthonomonadales bacterium]|nr:hypothetical protein [Chthonomonadales bacterium]